MRKTSLFILAAALLLAGFTGCNKNMGETVEQIQTEEPFAGMANPWKYDVSEQDVENLTGRAFTVPEGASEVAYGIMEQGKLGEMNFKLDGKSFCARMKPSEGFEDISGLYYEWDAEGVYVNPLLPFTGHGIIDRGCRELAHRLTLSIIP